MSENKEQNEVEKILAKMDEEIESASAVPFSNKKMVDADQLHEYIDSIRLNMPPEVKRAKDMAREKSSIMAEANREAEDIVAKAKQKADAIIKEAQAQADKLVSQQEIISRANEYAKAQAQRANEEAADIVNQAKEKEKAIREAMVMNINSSLSDAAEVLEKNLKAVVSARDAVVKIGER